MSFNADAHMAARNIAYEDLQPYNPAHETIAAQILLQAIPESIGEAYDRLAFLSGQMKTFDTAVDECLHCWNQGKTSGVYHFAAYPGKSAFMASDAKDDDPLLLGMRRIAMFDVPRRLFAETHGIWVYWLFNGVFVFSHAPQVNLDWAFQRHAYRLAWGLTKVQPATVPTPQQAYNYVREHLLKHHATGLADIQHALTQKHDIDLYNFEVHGPLFQHNMAWAGSITGREVLRRELNLPVALHTYNCGCISAPAPQFEQPPSAVKQLQNQSPNKRDC